MACIFETDVLIFGGGPAGTSAALSLCTYSSLRVLLVENSAFDVVRVGEQVNPSLFNLLNYLNIKKDSFEAGSFIKGYSSLAAWGSQRMIARHSIFSPGEEPYQLDREKFDLLLIKEASERGTIILPRTRCIRITQDHDQHWDIQLNHQAKGNIFVKAKFLIDATGRQCSIARQLGITSHRHDELVAVGSFLSFDNTGPLEQQTILETVEEGWWYCATLPNNVIAVTLFTDADILKRKKLHKAENWSRMLGNTNHVKFAASHGISHQKPWTKNAFSQISDSTLRTNFIAAGDAAASFDPISSMGIGFAVSSGCQSAHALTSFMSGNQSAIINYQKDIENIFHNYQLTRSTYYSKENRWKNSLFWQRRNTAS